MCQNHTTRNKNIQTYDIFYTAYHAVPTPECRILYQYSFGDSLADNAFRCGGILTPTPTPTLSQFFLAFAVKSTMVGVGKTVYHPWDHRLSGGKSGRAGGWRLPRVRGGRAVGEVSCRMKKKGGIPNAQFVLFHICCCYSVLSAAVAIMVVL